MKSLKKYRQFAFVLGMVSIMSLGACSKKIIYSAPPSISAKEAAILSKEKQIAYRFITAEKSEDHLNQLLSENFTSRDQTWVGDKETFIKKRNSSLDFDRIKPIRILQDSTFVVVHSRMIGDSLKFRWDILKIENEEVLEHWSNVQDSIGLNPDKHSEIDGPTIPSELEKTDINRARIYRFIDQCMIREDGGAYKFFNFGIYIQHNRDVGDGLSGLLWGMLKMKMNGETIKFKHNYHIIAEGNFVLSATEGYAGGEKFAFYDLFRLEEEKIVEHWDIIAPLDEFSYYNEVEN